MFAADRRSMGELPARDHRDAGEVDIEKRNVIRLYQVEARDRFGRWIGRGKEGSSDAQNSVGDLAGFAMVPEIPGRRLEPVWSLALPSSAVDATTPFTLIGIGGTAAGSTTTTQAQSTTARPVSIAAIREKGHSTDERLEKLEAGAWRFHTGIPKGQPGIMAAATEERSEEKVWLPSSIPLMSVQYGSPAQLSSVVYEAIGGAIDPNHASDLNTLVRIAALPQDLSRGARRSLLCWQLGEAATGSSHGACFQEKAAAAGAPGENAAGFASHLRGGPLDLLNALDVHLLGLTDRREKVFPVGLNILALWRDENGHDAPLDFEQVPYSEPTPRPLRVRAHIRHDRRKDHDFVTGAKPGMWRIEAEAPSYIPEDGDGIDGEKVESFELGAITVAIAEGAARAALGGSTERVTTYPGATRQGAALRFRGFATATGEPSAATGGAIDDELLAAITKAPDTAALVPVARGDGTWRGFKNSRDWSRESQALNDGGIMLIPPRLSTPEKVAEILAGKYETAGDGASSSELARFIVPEKLGAIDFARVSTGAVSGSGVPRQVSRSGIRLLTRGAGGVDFAVLDSTGDASGVIPLAVDDSNLLFILNNGTYSHRLQTQTLSASRIQSWPNASGTIAHRFSATVTSSTSVSVAHGNAYESTATASAAYSLPEITSTDDGREVLIARSGTGDVVISPFSGQGLPTGASSITISTAGSSVRLVAVYNGGSDPRWIFG